MMGTDPAGEQTAPTNLEALAGVIGELTKAARTVDRRLRRRTLWVAVAFVVLILGLSVRFELQQRQISGNSHQIAVTQYEQCVIRNEAATRQATLIDSAIAAEKRKPAPDAKRIKDLTNFRPAIESCGPKPK